MTAGSGLTSHAPFAYFDPDSSSLKTCAATFLSDSEMSSPTLPPSGSLRNGWLYERPMSVRATKGSASSGLLGTPNAHPRTHSPRQVDHGKQLANQLVELLPTLKSTNNENRSSDWAYGPNLGEALRLLPTMTARESKGTDAPQRQGGGFTGATDWGPFRDAIERHASSVGRCAPAPFVEGRLLSPLFCEWLMMLPRGWVTDVLTSRAQALKCLGNGVVPTQAAYALRLLMKEAV